MQETTAVVEIQGLPWRVRLTWRGTRRPVVTGISVTALRAADGTRGEVTAGVLRGLHIGGLIAAQRPQPEPIPAGEAPSVDRSWPQDADHYRAVAETYREAVEAGSPPVLAVADRFGVAHSVARRWVYVARNRHGLLPAVRRGQVG